ncbi:DUF6263 family protein [Formosa sp. S-31]|uniref:DUF6263 family protein n=1 Tax=Formosa sp. S-31 TaxID=2790949 RepID=UPI003EBDFF93
MGRLLVKVLIINLVFIGSLNAQNILQYRLKVGDSMTVNQQATQNIIKEEQGRQHNIQNTLEEQYTFKVLSKTDSTYILNFKFNTFKLKTVSNQLGIIVDIDTKKLLEENDTEGRIFSGLTASDLEIEMSKTGKIISVKGTEAMINKMVSLADIEDEFTKQLIIESIKTDFGNKTLSNSFEQLTHIYPDSLSSNDKSWKNTFTGEFNTINTWQLDKITDAIYLKADCVLNIQIQEEQTQLVLKGTQHINVIANKKTGFINEMTVTAEAQSPKNLNNPEETPTIITSKTTYKIQ